MNISKHIAFSRPVTGSELISFVRNIVGETFHESSFRGGYAIGQAGPRRYYHLRVIPDLSDGLVYPSQKYEAATILHELWPVDVHDIYVEDAETYTLKAIKYLAARLEEAVVAWPQSVMVCGRCSRIVGSIETGCEQHPSEKINSIKVTPV